MNRSADNMEGPRGALERFVVENDDLLELEERIGRFNIFDALGIARAEIRHSNFLAWLLDPNESHGQGSLFLKAVLMDLLKQTPPEMRPLNPIDLDGEELRGVEVRREWRNIDLLVICSQPRFVVAIENKVDAWLYNDLASYEQAVRDSFSDSRAMFVLLTVDAAEQSDHNWVTYFYADVYRVLDHVRRASASSIGDEVAAFLDHYLRLIGSRFMNDPTIDDLCRRIYENHRQAIDLIVERAASPYRDVIALARTILEGSRKWEITKRYSPRQRFVDFFPIAWRGMLPPIGSWSKNHRHIWLTFGFTCEEFELRIWGGAWSADDEPTRQQVIDRLTRDPAEFGLRCGKPSSTWTPIYERSLLRWEDGSPPREEQLRSAIERELDQLNRSLEQSSNALRPIIDEWKKSQPADAQR